MKKLILLSILLFLFNDYHAQNYVDLARFHYLNTPQNNYDSLSGSTNIKEFGADITLPIKLNDNNVILTGFYLEKIQTKLYPLATVTSVATINLKVGFNKKHSEKWSGTYMLLPKISSDLKKIGKRDFQLGALILLKYTKKKNFKYHVGLYYNNDLFGPILSPIIGLYYKSANNKFEANFILPIWADMNYKLADWVNIGTNFTAITRSYNLSENNAYLTKSTNEIYGYLQFNLKKSFLIQTKVGYSMWRSFESFNNDEKVAVNVYGVNFGDHRTVLNPAFKDGLIFKARLIYRFYIKQ